MPGGFGGTLDQSPCPCGGGFYRSCCEPLHRGDQRAETAEQLLRSRYSAFARREVDYLLVTHPEPNVPEQQRRRALERSCRQTHWLGLTVRAVSAGGPGDLEGTVQFEAGYRGGVLKETSLFRRRDGEADAPWRYVGALKLEG